MNDVNFFYKKNYLKVIFLLLIFLLFSHYVYQANKFSYLNNGWLIGDWLINYEGGFVRRGFSGEFFLLLNGYLNIELNRLVFYFQFLIASIFFIFSFFYFTSIKLDIFLVCLIFSPTILMFSFYDAFMISRKEFLIYIIFLTLIFLITNNITNKIIILSYLIFSAIFLPLITEIIVFYLPYFYLLIKINKNHNNNFFSKVIKAQLITTTITIFFILILGSQIKSEVICKIILERQGDFNLCSGIILDGRQNFIEIISFNFNRYSNYSYYLHYLVSLLITISLLNIYLYLSNFKKFLLKFNFYLIFLFLFSSPLFILGTDWGRWINIHFILITFLLIFIKVNNYKCINEFIISPNKKNYFIFFLFFFFSFSWNTWNCCPNLQSSNIFFLGGGIYERVDTLLIKILN